MTENRPKLTHSTALVPVPGPGGSRQQPARGPGYACLSGTGRPHRAEGPTHQDALFQIHLLQAVAILKESTGTPQRGSVVRATLVACPMTPSGHWPRILVLFH